MNKITNKKLSGLCEWAKFKGFSLLFNNPGNNLTIINSWLQKIDCLKHDPHIELYKKLEDAMQETIFTMPGGGNLFCPLPLPSYHVTVWDGVNQDNITLLKSSHRETFQYYLQGFPNSFPTAIPFHSIIHPSPLLTTPHWNITFTFDRLVNWGNTVLAARLKPADYKSQKHMFKINEVQVNLTRAFKNQYGNCFSKHWSNFSPHVSLGYFANREYGSQTAPQVNGWTDLFERYLKNAKIVFQSISLYGFTNMITYFKEVPNDFHK